MSSIDAALADFLIAVEPMAEMDEPHAWLDGLERVNRYAKALGGCARSSTGRIVSRCRRFDSHARHPRSAGRRGSSYYLGRLHRIRTAAGVVGPALLQGFQRSRNC